MLVRSTDRDPAYALVQHAIQWRRYHRAEVAAFSARTYIKAWSASPTCRARFWVLSKPTPA